MMKTVSHKYWSVGMALLAAIDQGTTSTRFIVTDTNGKVLTQAQFEHRQIMPREGWVEHDPLEIWRNTRRAMSDALASADIDEADIIALGLTNQRETAVVWDKTTGKPVYNAIVWQDTRTNHTGDPTRFQEQTGLLHNSYPAGPKWAWILDNVPGARERAENGELLAGTIDSWLIWNLTGGSRAPQQALHVTDVTNASRTLLMDLRTLQWAPELCAAIGVPECMLPEIRPSIGLFGNVRNQAPLANVAITGVLGDQQAALFGQGGLAQQDAKITYGTGLFMLLNTGTKPVHSDSGMLTTVAYQKQGEPPMYALEGSVAIGGSLIQWLRDQLGVLRTAAESEELAREVPDSGGVVIVPAFSGLFAPRWRPDARGVIVGLTRFVDRRHIARAALEATCLQVVEVVRAMGATLKELRVDGGMTSNNLLMQLQADLLDARVIRPENIETTVMGAASAAGMGAGVLETVLSLGNEQCWESEMAGPERDRLMRVWEDAVRRSYNLAP